MAMTEEDELPEIDGAVEKMQAEDKENEPVKLSSLINLSTIYRVKGHVGLYMVKRQLGKRHRIVALLLDKAKTIAAQTNEMQSLSTMSFQDSYGNDVSLRDYVDGMFEQTEGAIIDITNHEGMAESFGLPVYIAERIVGYYNDLVRILIQASEAVEAKQQE